MKIQLEPYNQNWAKTYDQIKNYLLNQLEFTNPIIEHIGSTSIVGLISKPIIDILVGLPNEVFLDKIIAPMIEGDYIYYEKFNSIMPYRRFFVKLKTQPNFIIPKIFREQDVVPYEINDHKLCHVHILRHNSFHWTRHIAFREYLKNNAIVRNEYQQLKVRLSTIDWKDGNEYNAAKNNFIKKEETKAMEWFQTYDK